MTQDVKRTKSKLSLIVAMANNGVIGRDGQLPWRMSSDLRWFKTITTGKPIIMGRTTYESLGRPLPGRTNIVLSRQNLEFPEGVIVCPTLDEALQAGEKAASHMSATEICVIGGANIYEQTLPFVDIIYLTRINADIEGDRLFPLPSDPDRIWHIDQIDQIGRDDKNQYGAVIEKWTRL
ncbi:MAG: dihydrofolate reductase [Pseudomonadota bacterium]